VVAILTQRREDATSRNLEENNIQHRIRQSAGSKRWMFGVRCSMFDVRHFLRQSDEEREERRSSSGSRHKISGGGAKSVFYCLDPLQDALLHAVGQ
jgi:hypothetical protein